MEPGTAMLAAQAIAAAVEGGSLALGSANAHKQKKKNSKQFKRQTYADLLSRALGLDIDAQAMGRQAQDQYSAQRAANAQDTGSLFRRALL